MGNKWNLPGKPGIHANIVSKCDNCGALDHISPKCPKPRDEEKCKKAHDARAQAKKDAKAGGAGEEAVEGVADVEVELVAEATVLLGTTKTRRKAPTLVL